MSSKQQLAGKPNLALLFGSPTGLTYGQTIKYTNPQLGNQSGGKRRKHRRQHGGSILNQAWVNDQIEKFKYGDHYNGFKGYGKRQNGGAYQDNINREHMYNGIIMPVGPVLF